VAEKLGVDHIVRHARNRGLAAVFRTGIDACLRLGADIIVNIDADNQYPGWEIPRLIEPILRGEADMVIGDRQTQTIEHFSPLKRFLQKFGSWVVRLASDTDIPDAASGFRAFSRDAALRLNIYTKYTYTMETIIQAGKKGLTMKTIPIAVNAPLRESRLHKGNWHYVRRNAPTILRLYTFYEPLRTFTFLSLPFVFSGLFLLGRFLFFYLIGTLDAPGRYVQSVVIGGTLLIVGILIFVLGIVADLIAANRLLAEETLYNLKRLHIEGRLPLAGPTLEFDQKDRLAQIIYEQERILKE
jgi:glycosyltransferase involved in cell wall biosynthesis